MKHFENADRIKSNLLFFHSGASAARDKTLVGVSRGKPVIRVAPARRGCTGIAGLPLDSMKHASHTRTPGPGSNYWQGAYKGTNPRPHRFRGKKQEKHHKGEHKQRGVNSFAIPSFCLRRCRRTTPLPFPLSPKLPKLHGGI